MAEYTLTAGAVVTDDGRTSIPLDPGNVDYRRFLEATGLTHDDVMTEVIAAESAAVANAGKERDRVAVLARSGRRKLVALGLTRPELRALGLIDPDPET